MSHGAIRNKWFSVLVSVVVFRLMGAVDLCSETALAVAADSSAARDSEVAICYAAYQERFEKIQVIEDIVGQGYVVVEKHIFDIPLVSELPELDEEGKPMPAEVTRPKKFYETSSEDAVSVQQVPTVRFFSAIDTMSHRAAVFLADEAGNIVYKTNQLECNYLRMGELEQPVTDMISVAFQDLNHDKRTDIILIAGCVNESGDYAGKTYKVGEVLFQADTGDVSFYRDWRVNDKLNRFGMNKSAKCIISAVREGCSAEFLYTATTEEELLAKGFHVIEEQSYWRNYEKLGRLRVLPGIFSMADYDIFMIYMVNGQGDIVWSAQPMSDYDNLYSLKGISGKDMDGDGMKDLVVLARYSKEDDRGEVQVKPRCSVYYQRTGGFDVDKDFVENYECTDEETMEELIIKIREYWGWHTEEL